MHLSLLLLATLLSPVLAASTDYILSHRFLSIPPSHHRHHPPSFQPYKLLTLTTSTDSRSPPDVSLADENFSSEGGPRHGEVDDGTGWYQVRLEDVGDGMEMLASTRACYLAIPGTTYITLHLSGHIPTGIEIKQSGTPSNGDCPTGWEDKMIAVPGWEGMNIVIPGYRSLVPEEENGGEVVVRVKVPERAQSPVLAPPLVIDETTGQPFVPPVEKTFLQKYWLPILGVGIFLVAQTGGGGPGVGR